MSQISTTTGRGLWAAAVLLGAVACNKGSEYAKGGATTGASAAARDTTHTARSDTTRVATAAGEVAPARYISDMNDSNIVAALDNLDKEEVAIGKLMRAKGTSDSIRAFATKLVEDHTKNEKSVLNLEREEHLAELPAKADTTRDNETHTLRKLRSMPKGRSLDSAFVHGMVVGHEHAVANAKAMEDRVKDSRLKDFLQQTVPTLQEHLNMAERLSQQLGATGAPR